MKKRISLRQLKPKTGLEKATKRILVKNIGNKDREESYFRELFTYGCQSGIVCGLIYYSETKAFYQNNRDEIAVLLSDLMNEVGAKTPVDLFGDEFDSNDPLCVKTSNQNLLAWFAFEETAKTIAYKIGLEFL
jgi:hypothetical protein